MGIPIPVLIGLLTAAPFALLYGLLRFLARGRLARELEGPRLWGGFLEEIGAWLEKDWGLDDLPPALPLSAALAVWAEADPAILRDWRLPRRQAREVNGPGVSLTASMAALWEALPEAARERTAPLLREAIAGRISAWSGAERGWNGQPFILPSRVSRVQDAEMRVVVVADLTSAPAPGPLRARQAADEAAPWALPLLLALQRLTPPLRKNPLGRSAAALPELSEITQQVGVDVGRRVGARMGGVLGPVGSAVGRYVGGLLGKAGARNLVTAHATRPDAALDEVQRALERLGEVVEDPAFARALRQPEEGWLALGREFYAGSTRRRAALREYFWPSPEQALGDACLRHASAELRAYRRSAAPFAAAALKANPLVRGGILLQNPWIAVALPGGPEAMSAARAALNRSALAARPSPTTVADPD